VPPLQADTEVDPEPVPDVARHHDGPDEEQQNHAEDTDDAAREWTDVCLSL